MKYNLKRIVFVMFCLLISLSGLALELEYESFIKDGIGYRILSLDDKTVAVTERAQRWEYLALTDLPASTRKNAPRKLPGNWVYTDIVYSGNVVIPATVRHDEITYTVTQIGYSSYGFDYYSPSIVSLTIPYTVNKVGRFRYKSIKELIIEDGETELDNSSGENYSSFQEQTIETLYLGRDLLRNGNNKATFGTSLKSVTIGDKVTSLRTYLFKDCTQLATAHFGKNVSSLGYGAFSGCSSLTSIDLTSNLTDIPQSAFYGCTALQTVVLPQGLTSIGDYAFRNCSNLENIKFPQGLVSIGSYAFNNTKLTRIDLPASLTTIGGSTFNDCPQLKTVVVEDGDTELAFNQIDGLFANCPIDSMYIGRSLVRSGWTYAPGINTSSLRALAFGDKVTKAGRWSGSPNLISVYFGKNISIPEEYMFSGCTSLKYIDMTSKLTAVYYRTFYNCTALESVILPANTMYLGGKLFEGCTSLESITIPGKVTEIGTNAFYGCTSLKNVVFEDGEGKVALEYPTGIFANCPMDSLYLGRSLLYKDLNGNTKDNYNVEAFPSCLKKLCLGGNASLERTTFKNVTSFTHIYPMWEEPSSFDKAKFADATYNNATLLVPGGTVKKYQATESWKYFSHIVPTSIGVTMTATEGGSIRLGEEVVSGGTKLLQVKPNSVLTFEIVPEDTHFLESLTLNGEDVTAQVLDGQFTPSDLSEDIEIVATFVAKPFFDVTATASTGGTATVSNAFVMWGNGSSVTFTPDEGHELVSVTVNGVDKTNEVVNGVLTLTDIKEDKVIVATFQKFRYTITASECENGSISLSASEVEWGDDVTATFLPDEHYKLATASVNGEDCTAQLDGNSLTLTDIRQAVTFGATFRLETFTITATYNEGGIIELSNDTPEWGSSITVTVTPDKGYELVSVSIDGIDVTADLTDGQYTIAFVERDVAVEAVFRLITEATIVLSADGERTYCCDHDLDFSQTNNIRAYIVSGYYPNTGYVLLTRVLEVPAGIGIVVRGDAGIYKVPFGESNAYYSNLLVGNVEPLTIEPTEGAYANLFLADGDHGLGFYPVTTSFMMEANSAYLQLPSSVVGGESCVKIVYEEDADGIEDIEHSTLNIEEVWYSLDGKKLDVPQRGINIIRMSDGTTRKVLIK